MNTWRYICMERPPAPGAIPKDGLVGVNYGEGFKCGKHTWGWVEYNRPLTDAEVKQYELALFEMSEIVVEVRSDGRV